MEIQELKTILMRHADAVMELAEKLDSNDGVPLQAHEKELLRTAMMPAITECMDLAKSSFIIGNEKWFEDNMKRLHVFFEMAM